MESEQEKVVKIALTAALQNNTALVKAMERLTEDPFRPEGIGQFSSSLSDGVLIPERGVVAKVLR